MTIWHALFSRQDRYRPSATVAHRLDFPSSDVEELQDTLEFVILVIREERQRLAASNAQSHFDLRYDERILPTWPEAA